MLPKISTPVFEVTLPISKQHVSFRPFLVKEQKILLMANETKEKDDKFLFNNIKQVIRNCCLSPINIDDLSVVDIEYFFIHLRGKSVGEIVDAKYRCENTLEDGTICNNSIDVSYNILDLEIENKDYNDLIKLTENVGIKMKFPNFESVSTYGNKDTNELMFHIIKSSIDYVYDENEIYNIKDIPDQELNEFIDSLNVSQLDLIKDFFNNIPSIKKIIEFKCNKCGFEHKIQVKGLANFFA